MNAAIEYELLCYNDTNGVLLVDTNEEMEAILLFSFYHPDKSRILWEGAYQLSWYCAQEAKHPFVANELDLDLGMTTNIARWI